MWFRLLVMPLKRPGPVQQTTIMDFFGNKRVKYQTEMGTMSEVGESSSQESSGPVKAVTHDMSDSSSESSQLNVTVNKQEPCAGSASEKSVQRSDDGNQGTHTTEQTLEYRETSPTLDMDNLFAENMETLVHKSPSSLAVISDVSSQEESLDLSEAPMELEKGIAKDQLKRLKAGDLDFSSFQNHVDLSISSNSAEKPDPTQHVKMPFYTYGLPYVQTRWDMIKSSLAQCSTPIKSSEDLEKIIHSYNKSLPGKLDFSGFTNYLAKFDNTDGKETAEILHKIAQLAMEQEHLFTQPIPFLERQKDQAITLSQHQIAGLLANAFFCTFPGRNYNGKQAPFLPSVNFLQLFASGKRMRYGRLKDRSSSCVNKLRCLFHYFKRVTTSMPTGKVTFHRQVLKDLDVPKWRESQKQLPELHVTSKGGIEDEEGLLQADFANKWVGGGALATGCVQEEIRFMITPELIVSRLFTEVLQPNECIIVTGCETFSTYRGYGDSFEWVGNCDDKTPRDEHGRKLTQVLMMDAIKLQKTFEQFNEELVCRELKKAYCGFYCPTRTEFAELSAVATGNWGCGAFRGDKQLKSLIQLMAAAEAGRDICYFTFDDVYLVESMHQVHTLIRDNSLSVGEVYDMIQRYKRHMDQQKKRNEPLFTYLLKHIKSGFLASSPERTTDEDSTRDGDSTRDCESSRDTP